MTPLEYSYRIKRRRTCKAQHACQLCPEPIQRGQRYFDGGKGRRAHVTCVVALGKADAAAQEENHAA